MKFIEYANPDALFAQLSVTVIAQLGAALDDRGAAVLAVPGGTTPGPLFDRLAAADLDWSKISACLTDERWVPEDSPRSNTALLRARLLQGKAAAARLLQLRSDAPTPEDGLPALEQTLAQNLPLDVCVLGMGADMHTASLFPGGDRLADALNGDGVLYPMRAAGAPEPRITLSAAVINAARHRHVVILGQDKRGALQAAQGQDPLDAPINAVMQGTYFHWAPKPNS